MSPKSEHLVIPRELFDEFHKGFSFLSCESISPAQGFKELHDAVCEAFSSVDCGEEERENINNFINALHNLYETLAEQEKISADSDGYFIEREDLKETVQNMAALGEAIRIHQIQLAHHDIAKALLWSKTALKKIAFDD